MHGYTCGIAQPESFCTLTAYPGYCFNVIRHGRPVPVSPQPVTRMVAASTPDILMNPEKFFSGCSSNQVN
jgi:hypothetical protein